MTVVYVLTAVIIFAVLFTAVELVYLLRLKSLPDLPDKADADRYSLNINGKSFEDLYLFLAGKQKEPSFSEDEVFYCFQNRLNIRINALTVQISGHRCFLKFIKTVSLVTGARF